MEAIKTLAKECEEQVKKKAKIIHENKQILCQAEGSGRSGRKDYHPITEIETTRLGPFHFEKLPLQSSKLFP